MPISKCKHGIYLDGCRECFPINEEVYNYRVDGFLKSMWDGTKGKAMSDVFGESQPKKEGEMVKFDIGDLNLDNYPIMKAKSESIDYTYVERRVPEELEDEAHELIDNWLKSKGYDPEAI